jgi:hypothetical protein
MDYTLCVNDRIGSELEGELRQVNESKNGLQTNVSMNDLRGYHGNNSRSYREAACRPPPT